MVENKLDRKYHIWIWLALIFSAFVKNVYDIYVNATYWSQLDATSMQVGVNVLYSLFIEAIIPVLACVVLAYIIYRVGAMRYVRCISRSDFIYWVMLATSVAFFVEGVVKSFGILNPSIATVVSAITYVTILFASMMLLYFLVFAKRYNLNPVEKYRTFQFWMLIFVIILGVYTFAVNGSFVTIITNNMQAELIEALREAGIEFTIDDVQLAASLSAIAIYVVDLIVTIVLMIVLQRGANAFQDPTTREDYVRNHANNRHNVRGDVYQTFGEDFDEGERENKNSKEKVFDEFDL